MQNLKNQNQNQIQKINLSKFSDALQGIEMKEKKERLSLYIYPDGFSKDKINGLEGKSFRGKMRGKRDKLINNILFFAKGNKIEDMKKEIELFNNFYKENYCINDYSLQSLSNKEDKNISLALSIIKEIKGNNEKIEGEKKEIKKRIPKEKKIPAIKESEIPALI